MSLPHGLLPRQAGRFVAATLLLIVLAGPAPARSVAVANVPALAAAIAAAQPGDDIVLADGTYPIAHKLKASAAGTPLAPITVRAAHPLAAQIVSTGLIAFEISGPFWHFSGLSIRGACSDDTTCEHAFHVVGHADGFWLRASRLADFNAHLKVNANEARELPANGLIENNEFFDSRPRRTNNPVATVNIDNATGWIVRGNWIHDFQKNGGGEDSYGAFVKGGSQAPLLERNRIECGGRRPEFRPAVGLSFGAHGMDPKLCPPHWNAAITCDPEVTAGVMRDNTISNCSGDGIYLMRAKESKILSNRLVNTGGIEFRYPSSTGVAHGNIMTGAVRATDGGSFRTGPP